MKTPPLFRLLPAFPLVFLPWLAAATGVEKPNVILMMADDMGMGDTSAYQDFTGNADEVQIDTPAMERLARMGVRFTDAHTPASRCSPTRYGLMTGRYAFRNRLKHWVLFGSQGDPMIEADRPTLATLFRDHGYTTTMVGKWHVGLRYRRSDGKPAAGWADADLTQPLHTTPADHGFDYVRFTSRSHATSGPDAGGKARNAAKRNGPNQGVGPGHLHNHEAVGATGNGKELVSEGENAYVLTKLGSRHSDHAIERLDTHLDGGENADRPFFLYYPSNSNHGPYTPDEAIGGVPVKGASRTKSGRPMDARHDYIYENDVALGRLLDYLEAHDDPRHPGKKLIETTVVIFTSDNGAEKNSDIASGPFRSHKGSCFEGGHRVPFIVAWGDGGIGDGNDETPGAVSDKLIGLTDLFATFAALLGTELPDGKGAEDSVNVLSAWMKSPRGGISADSTGQYYFGTNRVLFFHDHKESKDDPAVAAMRLDSPPVGDQVFEGKWKIFFDASLLRRGEANPFALYELGSDQREETNRLEEPELAPLVDHLKAVAVRYRTTGGERMVALTGEERIHYRWDHEEDGKPRDLAKQFQDQSTAGQSVTRELADGSTLTLTLSGNREDRVFRSNFRGLGVGGGKTDQVESGEAILVSFDRDVVVESAGIVAGNGTCGGFYQVGDGAPLAIYCTDAAIDQKDQSGLLSDIGILRAGEVLRLDSTPHYGVEAAGQWRLGSLSVRPLVRPTKVSL